MLPWLQTTLRPLALWNRRRLHQRQQRRRTPHDDWCRRHDTPDAARLDAIEARVRARLVPLPRVALLLRIGTEPLAVQQAQWAALQSQRHDAWQATAWLPPDLGPEARAWWQQAAAADARLQVRTAAADAADTADTADAEAACANANANAPADTAPALRAWLAAQDASGVAVLSPGEIWRPHTLLLLCEALALPPDASGTEAIAACGDEDRIDAAGHRSDPAFKGRFDRWALLTHDPLGAPVLWRRAHLQAALQGAVLPPTALMHALALHGTAGQPDSAVRHVPHPLAHRRTPADADPAAAAAVVQALLQQQGTPAQARPDPEVPGLVRVQFALPQPPPWLTVIVPTRNGLRLLRQCVDSLQQRSTWPHWDLVVVDNGSDDPACLRWLQQLQADPAWRGRVTVRRDDRPFNFAALNNAAVAAARGDVVALVNNDIEVISPDWMQQMLGLAQQPGVGAVGARLWYGDHTLQHAGVVLGVGGGAGHVGKRLPRGEGGPRGRVLHLQRYTAVTAACLVVRRQTWLDVGGMDEAFAVAFNDVDFCCRLAARGLHNLWTPQAELFHHESLSRGRDAEARHRVRFEAELALLKSRWGPWLAADPAWNPNLTLQSEDFAAADPPRVSLARPWYGPAA